MNRSVLTWSTVGILTAGGGVVSEVLVVAQGCTLPSATWLPGYLDAESQLVASLLQALDSGHASTRSRGLSAVTKVGLACRRGKRGGSTVNDILRRVEGR